MQIILLQLKESIYGITSVMTWNHSGTIIKLKRLFKNNIQIQDGNMI